MGLFKWGAFKSHSGVGLLWKIDCDALTDDDIETLARVVAGRFRFSRVHGVPEGGLRLAHALKKYATANSWAILIVDDVLTTGASMEEARRLLLHPFEQAMAPQAIGVVIFARGPCPDWVKPIFTESPL